MFISKKSKLINSKPTSLKALLSLIQLSLQAPRGQSGMYDRLFELLNKTIAIHSKILGKTEEALEKSIPTYKTYLEGKVSAFLETIQPTMEVSERFQLQEHESETDHNLNSQQNYEIPLKFYPRMNTLSTIKRDDTNMMSRTVITRFRKKRKTDQSKLHDMTLNNIHNTSFDCSFDQTARLSLKKSFDDTFINDETAFDWIQLDDECNRVDSSGRIRKRIKPSFLTSYFVNKSRFMVSEYHKLERNELKKSSSKTNLKDHFEKILIECD